MKPILKVENLGKQYRIGARQAPYATLRESLANAARAPFNWLRRNGDDDDNTIWALKDVSFEVMPGEVVGVIGRNGAGKSTLLKLLSRITEPTTGKIDLYGRVGSLLEVGTGFHAELSGRENIYLNGAILGMNRREIDAKFDEMVDFAEIEKFIDTPVKHYSSGMYMRLAFAVAAHLDPEILVIDEVLAVGDHQFQQKCLGKMKDISVQGRTVLFVSHNMAAIRNLCTKGIFLNNGHVAEKGRIEDCVAKYLVFNKEEGTGVWKRGETRRSELSLESVTASLLGDQPDHVLRMEIRLRSNADHKPAFIAVDIEEAAGTVIMQPLPTVTPFIVADQQEHLIELEVSLPPLIPGMYRVGVWVGPHNTYTFDEAKRCMAFTITKTPTENRTFPHTVDHGFIVPRSSFSYAKITA